MKQTRHALPVLALLTLLLLALAFIFTLIRRNEPSPLAHHSSSVPPLRAVAPPMVVKSPEESVTSRSLNEERVDQQTTGSSDKHFASKHPPPSLSSMRAFSIRTFHSNAILATEESSEISIEALHRAVELYAEQHPGVMIFDLDAISNLGTPVIIFSKPDYDITRQIEALCASLASEIGIPQALVD